MQRALEESQREEDARWVSMEEAHALSTAGECVVPPPPPPSAFLPESKPIEHLPKVYQWTGVLREWVSAPPIWLDAAPEQEAAYLQQ